MVTANAVGLHDRRNRITRHSTVLTRCAPKSDFVSRSHETAAV
jgi:hypothetical protein